MKITFLGGGNMAAALIGGLLTRGFSAPDLKVIELQAEARERLTARFGVACFDASSAQALECDVLVLAVKPQQMRAALQPVGQHLKDQVVVSIAAGMRTADIARWLGGYTRIVRTMPNTPALVGMSVTGLYASPDVDASGRERAERVLAAVGRTLWVTDEARMDAVTAVSGSGPGYVFYFMEALSRAARDLGFGESEARLLTVETFRGAAALAEGSDEELAVLRQRVTSPGGTTEAALKSLDAAAVSEAIVAAVRAADMRGRELGEELGRDGAC